MLHWPKKSLVMPFYYYNINFDQNGPPYDTACLEDKGLFRSANIIQIADVVRRVVFLLCF